MTTSTKNAAIEKALNQSTRPTTNRAVVEKISPKLAEEYLTRNTDINRFRSDAKVAVFAEAQKKGEWLLTPEPIAFDTKGRLIEGQHRLAAVVASGVTCEFWVIRGCDEDAFLKLGGGTRSASDTFTIAYKVKHGEAPKNATTITAVAAGMVRRNTTSGGRHTREEITDVAMLRCNLISKYIDLLRHGPAFAASLCSAFVNASIYYGDGKIEPMAKRFGTEMWTTVGDPLKLLHARMIKAKLHHESRNPKLMKLALHEKYAYAAAAIRCSLEGREVKRVEPTTLDFGKHGSDKGLRDRG